MEFITTINNIHFSLDHIDDSLMTYARDPDRLYEYAKLNVRKNGLHSSEQTIEYNLQLLAKLQDAAQNIPQLYIVISPSYDRWDSKREIKGMFDILFQDEMVYNSAEPEVVLAFLSGIKWSKKING